MPMSATSSTVVQGRGRRGRRDGDVVGTDGPQHLGAGGQVAGRRRDPQVRGSADGDDARLGDRGRGSGSGCRAAAPPAGRPGGRRPRRAAPPGAGRPSPMTMISSASSAASSASWVTMTVDSPASRCRRRSSRRSSSRTGASSALNGSSSRTSLGWKASARASATRCRWPPDSCAGQPPLQAVEPQRAQPPGGQRRVGAGREQHLLPDGAAGEHGVPLRHVADAALLDPHRGDLRRR